MSPLAAPAGAALPSQTGPLHDTDRWFRAAQFHAALRWSLLAVELFIAAAISGLALWGIADLLFELTPFAHKIIRAMYVLALLSGMGALLALVLKNLPRRAAMALRLEAIQPAFQGNLLAAVEALEHPRSVPPAVADLSADRAMRVLLATGSRPVMPRLPWTATHFWLLSAMAVTLSAAVLFGPDFFRAFMRGLFPFEAVESALALRFDEVLPGKISAIEGDAPAVRATLSGSQAGAVYLQVRERSGEGAPAEQALFKFVENGREIWKGALGVVRKDCAYRLVAYDAEDLATRRHPRVVATPWYDVNVRPGAGVRRLAVLIEAPGYTGYSDKWFTNPETVQALASSTATVLVAAGPAGDLGDGTAELPGGDRVPVERLYDKEGLTFYRISFPVVRSGLVRLDLTPSDDQHVGAQAVFALSVVQDLPPSADAAIPADAAPDLQGLPIELRLQDDIGLTGARLILATLPAEEGGNAIAGERDIFYEIPIPAGRRDVSERWIVPAQGLEAWLAAGFQYQVVAYDGARPAQTGRSPWRRWQPNRSARARSEAPGMLDGPKKAPRSLARPNAMGKVPDLTPDEVSKLQNPGAGVRPNQLQRPNSEHLENGHLPGNDAGQKNGAQGGNASKQPGGKGQSGNQGDAYEKPQGLGGQKPQPKGDGPSSGEQQDQTNGQPDPGKNGEAKGAKQGPPGGETSGAKSNGKEGEQTIGTRPGGKTPGGGEGKTGDGPNGSGAKGGPQGPDAGGQDGGETGDNADGVDPNEAGPEGAGGGGGASGGSGESGKNGQGGKGGQKKRDGGLKSGREAGAGGGKMAPPDLQTLARMKGISVDEARVYAQKKGIVDARTDFGGAASGDEKNAGTAAASSYGSFNSATLAAEASEKPAKDKTPKNAPPRSKNERVDPVYLPIVQGYFKRMQTGAAHDESNTQSDRK